MTATAEITVTQMQIMADVATRMHTFIIGVPIEGDPEGNRIRMTVAASEADQLVTLGFLEDLTEQTSMMLADLEQATGRKHRVFNITEMGKSFFRSSVSQLVN